jgi:hypothetical protein
MITFRKWVNIKREMGQCRSPGFGASAMFQTSRQIISKALGSLSEIRILLKPLKT